jgi:excisionase family DNA binding protein
MGFGLANQMMNQPGGMFAPQGTPPAGGAPVSVSSTPGSVTNVPSATAPSSASADNGLPELLSPAAIAQILKVEETDVIATLTDGSLKGKKIGTTWRITRASLDEFLRS